MQTVKVNPEILRWARETAGLEREEAARKLQIRDAYGVRAVDRLAALERGDTEPTRPMLLRMAKQYHRPLVTFYMSKPPRVGRRTAGFRRLTADIPPQKGALLDAIIRDSLARQGLVRAALEDTEEANPLPFIGSVSQSDGEAAALGALGSLLDVTAKTFHAQPNADAAFNVLRMDVEANGIFVLLKSDLGSYHTAIETDVFRGFAIADDLAPFVVINDRDARSAWSFTLLHELVHLLLGQSGMIASYHSELDRVVENFCDDVAGEFLLPTKTLNALPLINPRGGIEQITERISDVSQSKNLSRAMVAYRAFRGGLIERRVYTNLRRIFRDQWYRERDRRRQQNRQSSERTELLRHQTSPCGTRTHRFHAGDDGCGRSFHHQGG